MTKDSDFDQKTPSFHLLIVAAGSGIRMGNNLPKQYQRINGSPVLKQTLKKFINIKGLKSVSVVINPEHQEHYNDAVHGFNIEPEILGSNTRKNSVCNGLKSFSKVKNEEIIIIHDAARPLVHEEDILSLLAAMNNNSAATLATSVKDTLYKDGQTVDRTNLWSIQTPQAFQFGALKDAHEKFKDDDSFTDDASMVRANGQTVQIVESKHPNIKITTQDDFKTVEALMIQSLETRTASGFDVHAFEKQASNRKLILGGVEINHPLALTGHSDADVVLHAITDAILGAINEGDIGTHFPPSDPQWKDADSAAFLAHAYNLLLNQGGQLRFIDVTILAEEPKIGPHREIMQKRIAEILDIPTVRISIKATTTEQLGFTGRKEGIACQALATVTLPVTE